MLIALLAGTSQAQPRIKLVAFLVHSSEESYRARLDAFRDGMRRLGHVEGRSYRLALRWTDGHIERLPDLARELLRENPDIAVGAPVVAAQAFWHETKVLPIVMPSGAGALQAGMIASLARPGGNVTGVTNQGDDMTQKLFELLREIAPGVRRVMAVSSGRGLPEADVRRDARIAAATLGMTLIEAWAETPAEISQLPERCRSERCDALVHLIDPTLFAFRAQLIAIANDLRLPAVYSLPEFAIDGGLVAYGADPLALSRRAAVFVDRILKGAKPAELPVEQPTVFNLILNLRAARAIGLEIAPTMVQRADEVIE